MVPPIHTPVDAGLRLIAHQLGVSAALLFAADATGALHLAAAVGSWKGEEAAIQGFAEQFGAGDADVVDATDAIDGARFAAGARLGEGEGALLVLDSHDHAPDADWADAFATSSLLALGLVRSLPGAYDLGRLLHQVAVHPGTFDDRIALALQRAAEALGLDGAAFVHIVGGRWMPQAIFDPSGHLVPQEPLALGEMFCAVTVQSDGPFAVEDAREIPIGPDTPRAYIGAPVFVEGRCVGTFCVMAHAPRARPFSQDDRALVESLARWAGTAVEGASARVHADRGATLAAFFDGAPLGMGVARLLDDDLEFVRVNATAAAALGATPDGVVGRLASELGLGGRLGREWLAACRRAVEESRPQRVEIPPAADRASAMTTTVAHIGTDADDEVPRIAFVVDQAAGLQSPVDALLADAPLALFAADPEGRLVRSGGSGLDVLGLSLDTSEGRSLADLFADAPKAAAGIADALSGLDAAWLAQVGDRAFEIRVQGRSGPDGSPAGLIGVALDITGHHGATSLTAEAEARKALLKHLQHEIRSPLTSILGYAELLEGHITPEDLAEVRGVIERAGERLMSALDEMTLLGGDAPVGTPVPIEPCTVLVRAAEGSRPAAEARRLSLNLWCTLPDEPILMDAALFERLLRTLISGAVATAAGSCVDVRLQTAGASALEITVAGGAPGTAFGLPEAYVPRLAEALGGRARTLDGDASGWSIRLPRYRATVMEWPAVDSSDGARGEAPAMAFADGAA